MGPDERRRRRGGRSGRPAAARIASLLGDRDLQVFSGTTRSSPRRDRVAATEARTAPPAARSADLVEGCADAPVHRSVGVAEHLDPVLGREGCGRRTTFAPCGCRSHADRTARPGDVSVPHAAGDAMPAGGGTNRPIDAEQLADEAVRVQLASPIRPPGFDDAEHFGRRPRLVGREHDAEGREHDIELAVARTAGLSASATLVTDGEPVGLGAAQPCVEQLGHVVGGGHVARSGARRRSDALPLPAATSSTRVGRAQVDGLAQRLADDLERRRRSGRSRPRPRWPAGVT